MMILGMMLCATMAHASDPTADLSICVSKGVLTHYAVGSDVDVAAEAVTDECIDEGLAVARSQASGFAKRLLVGPAGEAAARKIVQPLAVAAIQAASGAE